MKTITVCPATLQPGYDTYSPAALKLLFDGEKVSPILDFDFDGILANSDLLENQRNLSISGVQEKYSAVVEHGHIRLTHPGEQGTFILKPAPLIAIQTRKQIPANEHLSMQIASQVYDIETAANALCFSAKGQPVYITRRFDVKLDLTKYPMEDFASVLGKTEQDTDNNFKYDGHYAMIADAIRTVVPAWMVETERFFKLVLFNYIYANEDAHLKNFSLINRNGEYTLAPAYDLLNTHLHLESDDLGLKGGLAPDIEPSDALLRTGHLCRTDFERFGQRIGLPAKRATRILDIFMEFPPMVNDLIARSFLNDKMKRSYWRIINQRRQWFARSE